MFTRILAAFIIGVLSFLSVSNTASAVGGQETIAYYGNWDIYQNGYFLRDVDRTGAASRLTTLVYSFENIHPTTLDCFQTIAPVSMDESNPNAGDGAADAWADYQRPFTASESVNGSSDTENQQLRGNFNQLKQLKQKHPNLKVFVSIGGWTFSKYFSDAAMTPESRAHLVSSCIDMYIKGNLPVMASTTQGGPGVAAGIFDGIDIDWEFPASANGHTGNHYSPNDTANFTALLAEFRSQLNARGSIDGKYYYLTAALPSGGDDIDKIQGSQILQYLDWAGVMSYDMHGAWEGTGPTNFQAPLYPSPNDPAAATGFTVQQAMQRWQDAGWPKSKLLVGLPFYWRGWSGVSAGSTNGLYQSATGASPQYPYSIQAGTAHYKELLSAGKTNNPYWDSITHSPWIYTNNEFYTGDTPNSLSEKAAWARNQGFGGVMIYSLESDDPSGTLLQSVALGLNGGWLPQLYTNTVTQLAARTSLSSPNTATNGEPINVIGGNYLATRHELRIPGRDNPVDFALNYNSAMAGSVGSVGWGWTHSYHVTAIEDTDDSVVIQNPDGRMDRFTTNGSGGYAAPDGIFDTLTRVGDHFVVTHKDHTVFTFNADGLLATITSPNGNTQTLTYDADNRLTTITDAVGRVITLAYNASNQLTTITDPSGRTVQYTYNAVGDLTQVTNPAGEVTHYGYDMYHRITTVVDPRGNTVVTNVYDSEGRVTQQTNGLGQVITLAYAPGQTTYTDARGGHTVYAYDADMRLTHVTDALGGGTSITYDAAGNPHTVTDSRGNTTTRTYDARGNLTMLTHPAAGGVETFTYDTNDNLLTHTNANARTTSYTYDAHGNITHTIDADNKNTTFTYNVYGDVTAVTDALNHTTGFVYDAQGNRVTKTDALNRNTYYGYDSIGRLIAVENADNDELVYTLDVMDRVTRIDDPEGGISTFTYDADGNKLTATDANNHTDTYTYDANNNLTSVTDALSHTTTYVYDANGNLTSKTDAKGRQTTYVYDALNRQTQVTDPLGKVTAVTYDAVGNVVSRTDASNRTTTYTYDTMNRLHTTTYPNATTITNTYDFVGNLLMSVNAAGITSYTYDPLNRVKTMTDPHGQVVTYTYDATGNLTQVKYPDNKTVTYTYTAANQLATAKDWNNAQTSYTYDVNGRLRTKTLPNTINATYSYDTNGNLESLVYKKGSAAFTRYDYARDAIGNVTEDTETKSDGTELYSSYTYDATNQLTLADTYDNTYHYTYDEVGNRTTSIDNGATSTYAYNTGNQLTAKDTRTFTYDNQGNQITDGTKTLTYNYDNQLTQFATNGTGTTTTHTIYADATTWGNWSWGGTVNFNETATVYNGTKSTKVTYTQAWGGLYLEKNPGVSTATSTHLHFAVRSNTANPTVQIDAYGPGDVGLGDVLLSAYVPSMSANTWYVVDIPLTALNAASTSLTGFSAMRATTGTLYFDDIKLIAGGPGSATTTFVYDAVGNRIEKNVNGVSTYQYVNSTGAEQVLVTKHVPSSTYTYYVYGGDLLSQGTTTAASRQYFVTDGLGNVRYLTNSSGNVVASYAYDPYGVQRSGSGNAFGYQTEQKDAESGLTYLRARYYDPTIGRFTAKDPFSGFAEVPATQNGYNYANNDPINLSDPSGMAVETLWDVANVGYDIATCDWGSLAADTASMLIPGVPAGLTKIGSTGKVGETALKSLGGESQAYFKTSQGARYVDQLAGGVANEAKVGYQSLTSTIRKQIAKDAEIVNNKESGVVGATWNFFKSPVTGLGGASAPLKNALQNAGITVKEWFR